jgi:chromosomal replication initiation ATPase DnaA
LWKPGLPIRLPNPLAEAWEGWVSGSKAFLKRVKKRMAAPAQMDQVPRARRLMSLDAEKVIIAVGKYYKLDSAQYATRRSTAPGRDLAAYLAHRRTTATLRELAACFGLGPPDSVSNLIRRAEKAISKSASLRKDIERIERSLSR